MPEKRNRKSYNTHKVKLKPKPENLVHACVVSAKSETDFELQALEMQQERLTAIDNKHIFPKRLHDSHPNIPGISSLNAC